MKAVIRNGAFANSQSCALFPLHFEVGNVLVDEFKLMWIRKVLVMQGERLCFQLRVLDLYFPA